MSLIGLCCKFPYGETVVVISYAAIFIHETSQNVCATPEFETIRILPSFVWSRISDVGQSKMWRAKEIVRRKEVCSHNWMQMCHCEIIISTSWTVTVEATATAEICYARHLGPASETRDGKGASALAALAASTTALFRTWRATACWFLDYRKVHPYSVLMRTEISQ